MAVSQELTLTQVSQSALSNSSQVRILWKSTQTGGSFNETQRTGYYYYSINNGTEVSVPVQYILPGNTTHVIVDTVITVPHDEGGNAAITVRTWMNTRISAGVVTLKKSLALDQIKRESIVSAADAVIGKTATVNIQRFNDQYTHSVYFDFGEFSGYLTATGEISESEVRITAASIPFLLPEEFYSQIPGAQHGICYLCCKTYLADTQIGEEKTTEFKALIDENVCRPTVSGSVEDVNETTVAVTGDSRILIRYMSTASIYVNATARQYAEIEEISVNGQTITGNALTIPNIDSPIVELSATDSRGLTTTERAQVDIVLYHKPTCAGTVERKDPTSGTAVVTLSGLWFSGSFNPYEDVPNVLTAEYSIDGSTYYPLQGISLGDGEYAINSEIDGLDYTKVHTVRIRVSDRLSTVEKTYTVKKGVPVFDWGENDFAFHVPVNAEGGLSVGGKSLLDMMYPVGAVYISTAETDPGTLFGGTWERLQDRFLLAAGESYPAGTVGGEATHTLTVEELPAHDHKSYGWAYANSTDGNIALRADGESTDYGTRQTGGGQSHNNMPPYLAVYMWKRTA